MSFFFPISGLNSFLFVSIVLRYVLSFTVSNYTYQTLNVYFQCKTFVINQILSFLFISNPILFVCWTTDVNFFFTSCNLLRKRITLSTYATIWLHLSNMVPCVFTLDFQIAVPNTTSNSTGAIAPPCLKSLLIFNSEDKCSLILTLAYTSLFKILHNLISFWGGGGEGGEET